MNTNTTAARVFDRQDGESCGLFELASAFWLILRGFNTSAIVSEPANGRPQQVWDYVEQTRL